MHVILLSLSLALPLLSSACSGPPGDGRPGRSDQPQSLPQISTPTGEPLGRAQCAHAFGAWLARTDSNHDAALSAAEFAADSRNVFSRLDRNGDGSITPDELQQARMPFFDPPIDQDQPPRRLGGNGPTGGPGGGPGRGRQPPSGGMGPETGQGNRGSGPTGTLDSVMTSDSNLDFKVSVPEFTRHSDETFAVLDKNADQRLSADEVTSICPSQPAAPSRR